jgi:hypothetical protein
MPGRQAQIERCLLAYALPRYKTATIPHWPKSYVHLCGNGRKERSVPLGSRTARTIKEGLREMGRNETA